MENFRSSSWNQKQIKRQVGCVRWSICQRAESNDVAEVLMTWWIRLTYSIPSSRLRFFLSLSGKSVFLHCLGHDLRIYSYDEIISVTASLTYWPSFIFTRRLLINQENHSLSSRCVSLERERERARRARAFSSYSLLVFLYMTIIMERKTESDRKRRKFSQHFFSLYHLAISCSEWAFVIIQWRRALSMTWKNPHCSRSLFHSIMTCRLLKKRWTSDV